MFVRSVSCDSDMTTGVRFGWLHVLPLVVWHTICHLRSPSSMPWRWGTLKIMWEGLLIVARGHISNAT
jgi:hypothetical protein